MINKEELYKLVFYFVAAVTASLIRFIRIKNNGSKLLVDGSTRINDFATDILTTNNGQTRVGGFATIGSHIEITGGTYKTAVYE